MENMEYVLVTVVEPHAVELHKDGIAESVVPDPIAVGGVPSIIALLIIVVRVLLNIHPWLTGLSVLRISQVAFDEAHGEPTTACLGLASLIWAVVPSALIHAFFDFIIIALPPLSLISVPAIWYLSRRIFMQNWPEGAKS